jgi:hypothetical protein
VLRVVRRRLRRAPEPLQQQVHRLVLGDTPLQRRARTLQVVTARARAARSVRSGGPGSHVLVGSEARGRPAVAHAVTTFRAGEVLAAHLDLVADALESAGVPYFVVSAEAGRPRVLVVAGSDRPAAESALVGSLGGTATYVASADGRRLGRPRLLGRVWPTSAEALRLFRYRADPEGVLLSGPELGVEIQFWPVADHRTALNDSGEPVPAGSLLGRRSFERTPEVVSPDERRTVARLVDGHPRPWLAAWSAPHLFEVRQPVDAVYTWVDGNDPAWRQRMAETLAGAGPGRLHALAANTSRFQSHDELRYSLRSLDMYASWIRHVYLVTDDQVPDWLDPQHPRLTVVSHRELFGHRGRLPTFNSHAIESQLHRIDGLSENYLYLNDDVFFGRPVTPEQFVLANGVAKFFLSKVKIAPGPVSPGDLPVTSAAKNNRDLLLARYSRLVSHKFRHVPHSLRRSVMYALEAEFADEVAGTASSQFRSEHDVSLSASLGHYYGFLQGQAVEGSLEYLYVDIGRPDTPERLRRLQRSREYDVFCLNDHDSSHLDREAQHRMVVQFLRRYFPLPSGFERVGADDALRPRPGLARELEGADDR